MVQLRNCCSWCQRHRVSKNILIWCRGRWSHNSREKGGRSWWRIFQCREGHSSHLHPILKTPRIRAPLQWWGESSDALENANRFLLENISVFDILSIRNRRFTSDSRDLGFGWVRVVSGGWTIRWGRLTVERG